MIVPENEVNLEGMELQNKQKLEITTQPHKICTNSSLKGKNTGRHKILSLSYLVVTLQSQEPIFRCDKQKSIRITYLMR